MKLRVRSTAARCLLLSALCVSPAFAQTVRPDIGGDTVKGVEAKTLLTQIETEQKRLIEERREALLRAEKAQTPEEKIKIMQKLQSAQRERKQKLREDRAKVREAEKQDRADKKRNSTGS